MPICCGESVQNSSPTRVPTNQPPSARTYSRRRAARRRAPQTPLARGEQTRLRASLGRAENSRKKRLLATLPSVFLFFGSWVDLSFLFNFDQGNAFLELRAGSVGASIMS